MKVVDATPTRKITSSDALVSMENIFYWNEDAYGWTSPALYRPASIQKFYDWQVDNPPFTGQTVLAASYGLLQVMYTTATQVEGFVVDGHGAAPHLLFDPGTSLGLGTNFVAKEFLKAAESGWSSEQDSYSSPSELFFQYAPALRGYNAGQKNINFSAADALSVCGGQPLDSSAPADVISDFGYACAVLNGSDSYNP